MGFYDEVDLGDLEYDAQEETYYYPCPCGDNFFITVDDLLDADESADCPSCSLVLRVKYDADKFLEEFEQLESEGAVVEGSISDPEDTSAAS